MEIGSDGLTAERQLRECRNVIRPEYGRSSRHHGGPIDAVLVDGPCEVAELLFLRWDTDTATSHKSRKGVKIGDVEPRGRELEHSRVLPYSQLWTLVVLHGAESAVLHHHGFGLTCRTRGEDDEGCIVGARG